MGECERSYSLDWFVDRLFATVDYHYDDVEVELTKTELAAMCMETVLELDTLMCVWCGVDVVGEYYMVRNEVWESCGPKYGCLCVGCLEVRLGRTLCRDDFTDVPVNTDQDRCRSERLCDRLGALPLNGRSTL